MTPRTRAALSAGLIRLPWAVMGFVFVWLLLVHLPPSGEWRSSFVFDGRSPWLATFLPGERVTLPGPQPDGWVGQRVLDDPVYAAGRVPVIADETELTLEARVNQQPLIDLGASSDASDDAANTQPVWSRALASGWHRVVQGAVQGYVRDGLPDSRLTTASPDHVLVWHATSTSDQTIDPQTIQRTVPVSLRGSHDVYFIPTQGTDTFSFKVQAMNRTPNAKHALGLRLLRDDDVVWTDVLPLPFENTLAPASLVFEKKIQFAQLAPGTYRLALSADDDVFVRAISTNVRHWVVGPRLYVGDQIGYAPTLLPMRVWTNSQHLTLETRHSEGIQTVHLGRAQTLVQRTHTVYQLSRDPAERDGERVLEGEKGDVLVTGDAFFAFEPEALFLPKPRRLTDLSDPIAEGIEAILTPYVPPVTLPDGWVKLTARVPLVHDGARVRWTLGVPGIRNRQGAVDIRRAELVFRRLPVHTLRDWWQLWRRELSAAWHRL